MAEAAGAPTNADSVTVRGGNFQHDGSTVGLCAWALKQMQQAYQAERAAAARGIADLSASMQASKCVRCPQPAMLQRACVSVPLSTVLHSVQEEARQRGSPLLLAGGW